MTAQEARNIINAAIEHGWLKPARQSTEAEIATLCNAKNRERIRAQQKARRDRYLAAGLTKDGKPRKRPIYASLATWTADQKRQRQLAQQRAWNYKHRETRNLPKV